MNHGPPPGVGQQVGERQIPILCKNCMGPATPDMGGEIVCGYCGFRDRLPADQLARALELSNRLRAAQNSVANVRGMESALSHVFERKASFFSAAGIYVAAAAVIMGFSLVQGLAVARAAPDGFFWGILINSMMGGVFIGGFAVALLVAFLVGRSRYRKHVRHHLFARLPQAAGLPARCRACDGALPVRRDPFVSCEYCHTENLVTPDLQSHHQMLAERERAFYSQQTGRALGAAKDIHVSLNRVLIVCIVLSYAAIIGLAYAASASFPTA